MRTMLAVLLAWTLGAGAAGAFEVDFKWRWPGMEGSAHTRELVAVAAPHFNLPPASGVRRVVVGPGAVTAAELRVTVHGQDRSRRSQTGLAVFSAKLEPGQSEVSIPLKATGGLELELEVRLPDGRASSVDIRTGTEDVDFWDNCESRKAHLLVGSVNPVSRLTRQASWTPIRCLPSALPRSEAGFAPFKRIVLSEVDLAALPAAVTAPLVEWVRHGGVLLVDRVTFESGRKSPLVLALFPREDAFTTVLGGDAAHPEGLVVARAVGLGKIVVQPRSGVYDALPERPDVSQRPGYSFGEEEGTWLPPGARLSDRLGRYATWMIPYLLALAGLGLLLVTRKVDRFLRVAPAIVAAFGILYWLVFLTEPADVKVLRTRVYTGQAGDPQFPSRLHTSVFCGTDAAVKLGDEGPGARPPWEQELPSWNYSRNSSVPGNPVLVERQNGGWTIATRLFPAQVRTFIRQLDSVRMGAIEGSVHYDPTTRRWKGSVASALSIPLDEAHVVIGWQHQKLGPLAPGQKVAIDISLTDLVGGGYCRPCGTTHEDHLATCASCGVSHPIAGPLADLFDTTRPELQIVLNRLKAEEREAPEFFAGPMLVGLVSKAGDAGSQPRHDLFCVRLPLEQLEAPGIYPGASALHRWTVASYRESYAKKAEGCNWPRRVVSRSRLDASEAMQFLFPYRGPVKRLTIDLGTLSGTSSGGNILFGLWNHRKSAYDDVLRKGREIVTLTDTAGDYFDPRDGSVTLKVPQCNSVTERFDVSIEGSGR